MNYRQRIEGKVFSEKGFYIGDLCYAIPDNKVWEAAGYNDGIFEVPGTGLSFAVGSTYYGDGCYSDQQGRQYGVDAGVLSIVPLELIDEDPFYILSDLGTIVECKGEARFVSEDGIFDIDLPNGENIYIDTQPDYEDEDEDKEDTEVEDDWDTLTPDEFLDKYL